MQPIITCLGARGARWPAEAIEASTGLSPLEGDESLLEGALERIGWTGAWATPLAVVRAGDADAARAQLEERQTGRYGLITLSEEIPPAYAIAIATLEAEGRAGTALVVPADHRAEDGEAYRTALKAALESAQAGRVALVSARGRAAGDETTLIQGKAAGPSPWTHRLAGQRNDEARQWAWRNTGIVCTGADAWLGLLERRRAGAAARARAMHARALRGEDTLHIRPERGLDPTPEEWARPGEHRTDAHPDTVMVGTQAGWERVETWQGQAKWENEKALSRARASGALHVATRETLARVGPEQSSKAVIVNATERLIVVDTARGTLVERIGARPLDPGKVRAATQSPIPAPARGGSLEGALHAEMDKRTTPGGGASAKARERACIERWAASAEPAFEEALAQATVSIPFRADTPPSAWGEVARGWKARMEARLEAIGARGAVLSPARAEAAQGALAQVGSEAARKARRALARRQGIGLEEAMERVRARCARTASGRIERAWTIDALVRLSKMEQAQWSHIERMPHWLIHAAAHDAAVLATPPREWAARAAAHAGGEAPPDEETVWAAIVGRIGRGLRHWRSRDAAPPLRAAWACATHGVEIESEAMWALAIIESAAGWSDPAGTPLETIAAQMLARGAHTLERVEEKVRARAIETLAQAGWGRAEGAAALDAADATWRARAQPHQSKRAHRSELVLGRGVARVVLRYTSITRMVGGMGAARRARAWRTARVLRELRAHSAVEVALGAGPDATPVGWRKRRGGGGRWPIEAQCENAREVLEACLPDR